MAMLGWLLSAALGFGQTNQQPTNPQASGTQPNTAQPNSQSASTPPVNQAATKPSAVAAAANASRLARESAAPIKVIRNHDISDGSSTPDAGTPDGAATRSAQDQDKETQEEERNVQQFEAQGKTFQNQIKVEKGKIIDIQNHITLLKNQFAVWSAGFAQDDEASSCWTNAYYSPYYKEWCDRGRNLKAQYEASQRQLDQEKARLEQMQENIRRAGYGNAVYEPD
jgi:hypothetical protein